MTSFGFRVKAERREQNKQNNKEMKHMPNSHKIDIKRLEKKVTSISDVLANLSSAEDFRRLILEWRRPGWTTPAEFILVSAIVDSMAAHIEALANLKGDLIKGSKAVTGQ